jgi:hypothetical protein
MIHKLSLWLQYTSRGGHVVILHFPTNDSELHTLRISVTTMSTHKFTLHIRIFYGYVVPRCRVIEWYDVHTEICKNPSFIVHNMICISDRGHTDGWTYTLLASGARKNEVCLFGILKRIIQNIIFFSVVSGGESPLTLFVESWLARHHGFL